jgi:putative FmdB family regulatory protein
MPTYQYACTNPECGNRFDLVQSFTDPSASDCPVCGAPVRKVFSAVGVVFKGSGFYRNDSRASNGKAKGGESKERANKESSPSGSDGKSADVSKSTSSDSGSSTGTGKSAGTGKSDAAGKSAGKAAATPA